MISAPYPNAIVDAVLAEAAVRWGETADYAEDLCTHHYAKNRYQEAANEALRWRGRDPMNPNACWQHGDSLKRLKKYDEAIEAYSAGLALSLEHSGGMREKARCLWL